MTALNPIDFYYNIFVYTMINAIGFSGMEMYFPKLLGWVKLHSNIRGDML